MWLYEDLIQEKPKSWLRAKRNREIRKERKEVELSEEDRLLTPEEIKAKRLKRQQKEAKDRWLIKEKQWMEERNAKYWLDIGRTYVYLKEDFRASIAETYHELENESHIIPERTASENDEKDKDYILSHKYDWFADGSRFWMSRYNGYVSRSNARDRWTIWDSIKLIPTTSLQQVYINYLDAQKAVRNHLSEKAKERGMSVQSYVDWGYREEDVVRWRRWYLSSRRATFKPREWSWLEEALSGLNFKHRIVALDYVRMIHEWTFCLTEACIPFKTYIVGDYVLFGNKACAVPSMFWNWEFFSEKNRELIHRWWRYALRIRPIYNIANKIPIFNWTNMKLVKVSSEKISDKDERHNNSTYSFYLVPQTSDLWRKRNKTITLEQAIERFHTPDADLMELKEMHPKTTKENINFTKKCKRNIFYFDTTD